MSEPRSFTYQPQCIKCGEHRCHWQLRLAETTGVSDQNRSWIPFDAYMLEMSCTRCGWQWTMRTLDYVDVHE